MIEIKHLVSFLFLIHLSKSTPVDSANKYLKQFNHLVNIYQKCNFLKTSPEFYNCLKQKLIITLDGLAKPSGDIEIIPGYLVLVSDNVEDDHFNEDFTKVNVSMYSFHTPHYSHRNSSKNSKFESQSYDHNTHDRSQKLNETRNTSDVGNVVNNVNRTAYELVEDAEPNTSASVNHLKDFNGSYFAETNGVHDDRLDEKDSSSDQQTNLNSLLRRSLYKISRNRSLLIKLPLNHLQYLTADGDVQEGRKKKNNNGMVLLGCMMMGGTLLSLGFGSLAVLAGKALMTSLLALMLSLMAAMSKKGGSHGGLTHAGTTYEVINVPSGSSRAYKKRHQVITVFPSSVTADGIDWDSARGDYGGWNSGYTET